MNVCVMQFHEGTVDAVQRLAVVIIFAAAYKASETRIKEETISRMSSMAICDGSNPYSLIG